MSPDDRAALVKQASARIVEGDLDGAIALMRRIFTEGAAVPTPSTEGVAPPAHHCGSCRERAQVRRLSNSKAEEE